MKCKQLLPQITRGNSVPVRVAVTDNGLPVDFTAATNVKVYAQNLATGRYVPLSGLSFQTGEVSFTVAGEQQFEVGTLAVVVQYRMNGADRRGVAPFLGIVEHACQIACVDIGEPLRFSFAMGDTGKSAYRSAVDGGFAGTEEDFNERLAASPQLSGNYLVNGNSASQREDGSPTFPFKRIQNAIDAVTGSAKITVLDGNFADEDLVIAGKTVVIEGRGVFNTKQMRVKSITITGTGGLAASTLYVAGNLEKNSSGSLNMDNVSVAGATSLLGSGTLTLNNCLLNGAVNVESVGFTEVYGTIFYNTVTLGGEGNLDRRLMLRACRQIKLRHLTGRATLTGSSELDSLESSANFGYLYLISGSAKRSADIGPISKTGTCPYMLCQFELPAAAVAAFAGTRDPLDIGLLSAQVLAGTGGVNYAALSPYLDDHLRGIDAAIGELKAVVESLKNP